uniref:Uncharacterized protein n=1 Tax=Coccolithus braarudii TaxID=221442 RepID=A0A7S0PV70_9EUKA|mmetsp:Transcript_12492/g.26937  ORF Transcript_12492/g.26937 Transcript_12492/m.26937 type:complete len:185 (+) Transcript_12492:104-658(+)
MHKACELVCHKRSGSGVFLRLRRPFFRGDLLLDAHAARVLVSVMKRKPRMGRVAAIWEACTEKQRAEELLELVGAEVEVPDDAVAVVNKVAQSLALTRIWWKELARQPGVPVVSREHMANRLWQRATQIVRSDTSQPAGLVAMGETAEHLSATLTPRPARRASHRRDAATLSTASAPASVAEAA